MVPLTRQVEIGHLGFHSLLRNDSRHKIGPLGLGIVPAAVGGMKIIMAFPTDRHAILHVVAPFSTPMVGVLMVSDKIVTPIISACPTGITITPINRLPPFGIPRIEISIPAHLSFFIGDVRIEDDRMPNLAMKTST
jgi:hypothetical protein